MRLILIRPIAILLTALLVALAPASLALAQDLPPGPSTLNPLGRVALNPSPGRIDEVQTLILDFAPGAWTPPHTHGGTVVVRVLEGEMTHRVGTAENVYRPGESWIERSDEVGAAGNAGTTPARILATFLLTRGAPLTTVAGAPSAAAPPGPTTAYQSQRAPVITAATGFTEAATTLLGFAPGTWTPWHSHGGLTLVSVLEGTMTVRSLGRETVYRAGDIWIEQPGDVHAAGNATASEGRVAVTFLLRTGAPVTTIAASQPPITLTLPRTGTPLPPAIPTAALTAALLGAGFVLRRSRTHTH